MPKKYYKETWIYAVRKLDKKVYLLKKEMVKELNKSFFGRILKRFLIFRGREK